MGSHLTGAGSITNEQLDSIHHKISLPPKILCPSAGNPSCCIFRVPRRLVEANGHIYYPRIVSLGPYHLNNPDLSMIQEHKYHYLSAVLSRCPLSLSLESLIGSLEPLIEQAIKCYSESISLSTDEFLEMLVLDSVFLIELFMRSGRLVQESGDPIFTMSWVLYYLCRDFLCLENQIPYFILEKIYNEVARADESALSLAQLALKFFKYFMQLPEKATASCDDQRPQHLLDLVRANFVSREEALGEPRKGPGGPIHMIQCVSKLRQSGIHLQAIKREKNETFLAVRFDKKTGLLEMPTITMDELMGEFLVNCIAYEQCHNGTTEHFTTYAYLLDSLVNTARDVEYLCYHEIIENCLGTDGGVARLINNMVKEVTIDFDGCYLSGLLNDVHDYSNNRWHVQWAGFKYKYFNTPWSFISAVAAFVLLLLTLFQTFLAIYAYFFPSS